MTASIEHAALMGTLSAKLDRIHDVLPRGSRAIFLDVPVYFNVGDLLINAGTEAFFRRSRITPVLRLSLFDVCSVNWSAPEQSTLKPTFVRAVERVPLDVPIVFQGGGNFGDLYTELQAMRERVVAAFPNRRIVILPQSLHFDDALRRQKSLGLVLGHPDLHLFVRDRASLEMIQRVSPEHGTLMPDMAHALWNEAATYRDAAANAGTLTMLRRDDESTLEGATSAFDWEDIVSRGDTAVWRLVRKAMYLDLDPSRRLPVWIWYALRDRIIARAARYFARYGKIETDRLHGLLLACLLGREVGFRDNRYGKLTRYASEWLEGSPLVRAAA